MARLIRTALLVAGVVALTLAVRQPAAADDGACQRTKCGCETSEDESTCSLASLGALVGKFVAQATYEITPQQQAQSPNAYIIEPPDVLTVSFTADAGDDADAARPCACEASTCEDCGASCPGKGKQSGQCNSTCPSKAKPAVDANATCDCPEKVSLEVKAQRRLVGADGKINLGPYGAVYVAGMTVDQAQEAIEKHLAGQEEFQDVTAKVDVLAMNSKVYFVIEQKANGSDSVSQLPITGNETVIDAIAAIGSVSPPIDCRMWIARPAPNGIGQEQVLPVNWNEISNGTSTATNHQLMPGDRLYLESESVAKPPSQSTHVSEASSSEEQLLVCYDIQIIEDSRGCLDKFAFREEGVVAITDELSVKFQFAMKNCVDVISRPKLVAPINRTASLSIGERAEQHGKDAGHWIKVSITGERRDDKLVITLDAENAHAGRRYEAHVENMIVDGQTLVVRMNSVPRDDSIAKLPPAYLIVTPSIPSAQSVKLAEPRRYSASAAPLP